MADGSIKYIDFNGDRYEIDPCNHASESADFGVGASGVYGHCKVIDDFTNGGGETNGRALSAHAGYVLNKMTYLVEGTYNQIGSRSLTIPYPIEDKKYDTVIAGGIYKKNNSDNWEDMKTTLNFYYEEDYILTTISFNCDYKVVLITR
jgi:hypothetical protein